MVSTGANFEQGFRVVPPVSAHILDSVVGGIEQTRGVHFDNVSLAVIAEDTDGDAAHLDRVSEFRCLFAQRIARFVG
jgi:hypothetical protein